MYCQRRVRACCYVNEQQLETKQVKVRPAGRCDQPRACRTGQGGDATGRSLLLPYRTVPYRAYCITGKAAASELPGLGHPFWSKREGRPGRGGNIQKRIKTQNQVLSNLVPVSHTYPGTSTVRWRFLGEKAPVPANK